MQEAGHFPLHGPGATMHVLVDEAGAVVVDAGLYGGPSRLKRLFAELSLPPSALRAVLLTHGHLDHTGGLAAIRAWSGAPVLAGPGEQPHVDGTFPYRGWARFCGAMERVGRCLLRYRPVAIDRTLTHGEVLPYWGGLEVVHLPGHTDGHCGYYSRARDVLFSGDLFASFALSTHQSPRVFTSRPELVPRALARVRRVDPAAIYPAHYARFRDGRAVRDRFDRRFGRSRRIRV